MEKLMKPMEIAAILGVSVWTVYEEIKAGKLGAYCVGGRYRISSQMLQEYLRRNQKRKGPAYVHS